MAIIISIVAGLLATVFFEPAFIRCCMEILRDEKSIHRRGDLEILFESKFFWIAQITALILTTSITFILIKLFFNASVFFSDFIKCICWILIVFSVSFVVHLINSLICGAKTILEYLYSHLKWIKNEIFILFTIIIMVVVFFK